MNRFCAFTLLAACLLVIASAAFGDDAATEPTAAAHFDAAVAPVLAQRCLECHNPSDRKGGLDLTTADAAAQGGDSGSVLTRDGDSPPLFVQRIAAEEMPPKRPLTPAEKTTLTQWVESGAAWGSPIDRFRYSSDTRAGYDWWSLQPVRRPQPPQVAGAVALNPIDAFLAEKLSNAGLQPNDLADRRTLYRRLAFDVWGLPPNADQVQQFVADDSPEAYETLVERLLASPDYGQRWARHWLDVVRFGESQGFEYDKLRPTAFHYRDWVIRALNQELPYDEFVRQQIAGDVLTPNDPQGVIATGFLVAGPWDQAGQMQQSAAMRAVVRQDELEDMIGVTSQTVLGLTVNCARCHDHKFDPIRQSDYYQLAAALAGVVHGERPLPREYVSAQPDAAALAQQRQSVLDALGRLNATVRNATVRNGTIRSDVQGASRTASPPSPTVKLPKPRAAWDFTQPAAVVDPRGKIELQGGAVWDAQGLHVAPNQAYASLPLAFDLAEKTLEAWVRLDNTSQQGGAAISIEWPAKAAFDAIVFGERYAGQWIAGSEGFARTRDLDGEPETADPQQVVHVAVTYAANGTISVYRHGRPYGRSYTTNPPKQFRAGEAQILFGLRHMPPGPNRTLAGVIVRAAIYDRALTAEEVAGSALREPSWVDPAAMLEHLNEQQRSERETLLRELAHLDDLRRRAQVQTVYANVPVEPPPTTVLARGNPAQPGEVVAAAGVHSLGVEQAAWQLASDAPEAQRRLRLAHWLTEPANPLTARVIVNRLWQHHFGVGLVDTPNDFGFSGARPSHPELLDWLAAELIDGGWRLKHVHRLILNSAAYRRSSAPSAAAQALDADNRLLWRYAPRRLQAETLRDAILAVSGQLNAAMGGPGFHDFKAIDRGGTQFYEPWDAVGPSFQRRSIYRTWARSGRNPLLDVLDCPDPSTTTPRRANTTTPLQALALLNQSFVLRAADAMAQRAARECGNDLTAQVEGVYQWTLQRPPDDEQRRLAVEHASAHGLAAFCRVLLNTSEFLYVD